MPRVLSGQRASSSASQQQQPFAPSRASSSSPLRLAAQSQRQARTIGAQHRAKRLQVAAIEQPSTYQPEEQQPGGGGEEAAGAHHHATAGGEPGELDAALEVAELDAAQEDLLKWMLFLDGEAQDADLEDGESLEDAAVGEYADLFDEVEQQLDEAGATFRVGDKVFGTVYEVDEDGAYVEIGAKAAGFVPLSECSLGKLRTVRARWASGASRGAQSGSAGGARAPMGGVGGAGSARHQRRRHHVVGG